jgi:hypothetical protein
MLWANLTPLCLAPDLGRGLRRARLLGRHARAAGLVEGQAGHAQPPPSRGEAIYTRAPVYFL